MIPNMDVWRPCDAVESAVAWARACENEKGPTSLIFSRQGLPHQERSKEQIANISRGGYILRDCDDEPDCILIATGSEVAIAVEAAEKSDKKIRVVSMPSTTTFDKQEESYKDSVLPKNILARVAVEAACSGGWYKYVGTGKVVGIDTFGESAPAGALFKEFGFTTETIEAAILEVCK